MVSNDQFTQKQRALLNAIRRVESSNLPDDQVPDNAGTIGPYQIGNAYYIDSGVPGGHAICRTRSKAE